MNNPIKIFGELQNVYLKYINSGLPFSRKEYNDERNKLMDEAGTICQPPIIEIVPKYHEKASLREFCEKENVSMEINDFVNSGLFVNDKNIERRLYDHQYQALKDAFIDRKNIIVTTGTGSGKTECFLLPVIADLVTESAKWGQVHPRAMRTMILYPLNALAEDQMIRLRKALNSRRRNQSGALDWLDKNRDKHRFYFGRYTGSTPVSGTKKKALTKYYDEKKALVNDWEAAKDAAKNNETSDLLYHVPCMEADSAEMWDRFSMQDNAPDIMITNYSMLNVMLMRDLESGIFEDTKKWLQEDESNVFHLVIDELHTYRGTAGTEVAYLIRVLLDRLGLTPDSKQVQFLASSASMEDNDQTRDYICSFFGVNTASYKDRFSMISNPVQTHVQKPDTSLPFAALEDYANNSESEEEKKERLFSVLGCPTFEDINAKYKLSDWLKYSLQTEKGIIARDIDKIASTLNIKDHDGRLVVESIIKILCQSKTDGSYVLPLRSHFFFRSINGLWGCSDPNCNCIKSGNQFEGRYIGKLYKRPRTVCDCGNKILEVLICENCGDVFLGGYKIIRDGKSYLSVEKPISETFCNYCVLWKGANALEQDGWVKVDYDSFTGEYCLSPNGEYFLYEQKSDSETCFPHKCPNCEVSYRIKDKNSMTPVRRHSVGLQKINQILADSLIRSMKNEKESNTKVVLFSDSRQSAAKLSAGIELDHFRDVMRWSILNALKGDNSAIAFLKSIRHKSQYTQEELEIIRELQKDKLYGEIIKKITFENLRILCDDDVKYLDNIFNNMEALKLDSIEANVFKTILSIGTNPAGPMPSVTYDIAAGDWFDLFNFKENALKDDLEGAKLNFGQRLTRKNKTEQLMSIFSNKNNSFEELKLGYLVPSASCEDSSFREMLSSVIRILGEKRRIMHVPSKYPIKDSFPLQVKKYVKTVYNLQSKPDIDKKLDEIKTFLRSNGIIDREIVALKGDGLSFVKSDVGSQYWECPRCKTIHMHHSNGFCVNCCGKLDEAKTLTANDVKNPNDYYLTLLNSTENVYRLRCEELTGQTSKSDSRKRQRLFQDIFLKTENPKIDGIDLLSVTTTMEAGVDIGSLSAVMMGNVPPQRFNYQQRVGRAGRRGNPLSIAMTVARGNSHDLTHFFETERMVSDTPKDPYLEVRTKEIAERIIYKEILNAALGLNRPGQSDSVHGNFGSIKEWGDNKLIVSEWISNNAETIKHIIKTITRGTEITVKSKDEILNFIENNLVDTITEKVNSDDFTQDNLSERLANAGMLPMFGFPTRTRNLYLSEPKKLPAEDVVSRDVDMAINSFAPGHEIVKDKKVYRSIGIVDYEYNSAHLVTAKKWPLHRFPKPLKRCKCCGYSSINMNEDDSICPVCGKEMEKVNICSPLGFCVDYNIEPEDFNGNFDWYSPNSEIKLDCEDSLSECPSVNNLLLRNNKIPSQGLVHLVNDNNGDFYKLGRNNTCIYVSRDAYPEEIAERLNLSYESKYAFVSSKSTGVLTIGINKANDNVCLDPINERNSNSHAVRAAFLSWGYLVRKAVSSYLDIDSAELNVGYYISPKTQKAETFFVERLENGAGYCNYLSGRKYKDIPKKAIIEPLLKNGNIYSQLVETKHRTECICSCYDCIRDYSNQSYHGILDWRLGLDLAKLADDNNAVIDFSSEYWTDYINITLKNILTIQNFSVERAKNTLLATGPSGIKYCLIHPLWSEKYINKLIGSFAGNVKAISVFDISKLSK